MPDPASTAQRPGSDRQRRAGAWRRWTARIGATAVLGVGLAAAGAGTATATSSSTPVTVAPTSGTNQSARAGSTFSSPLVVEVTCQGTPVGGAAVTFTTPAAAPTATFGTSGATSESDVTDSSGYATSSILTADDVAGTYTATASVASLPAGSPCTTSGAPTVDFTLTNQSTAGVAAGVVVVSGSNQTAAAGTDFADPLEAEVVSSSGAPVAGTTVTFAVQSNDGATASFASGGASATETTNADGVAVSPTLVAGTTAGSYTATATAPQVAGSATFELTTVAGSPATVTAGVGADQQTAAGTAFAIPLAVTVTDADHNAVADVPVTFSAPTSGASGTFSGAGSSVTVDTDSSGIAVAPTFVANSTVGGYVVTATVSGVTQPAVFMLVNQVPTGSGTSPGATSGPSSGAGYWLVGADGAVFGFGAAPYLGGANTLPGGPGTEIVGAASEATSA
jgi:hypothetical protein